MFILREADGDIDTSRWAGGTLFTPLLHPVRVHTASTFRSAPPVRGVVLSEEIGIWPAKDDWRCLSAACRNRLHTTAASHPCVTSDCHNLKHSWRNVFVRSQVLCSAPALGQSRRNVEGRQRPKILGIKTGAWQRLLAYPSRFSKTL